MGYRERIRPIHEDDPICLMTEGPRFCSSASVILVELAIVVAVIWIFTAAIGVWR